MALAFALIERTYDTLRWRATSTNVGTAACDSGIITNRNDGSDAATGLRANSSNGSGIGRVVRSAVTTQAGAQRKLNGEGLVGAGSALSPTLGTTVLTTGVHIERCNLSIDDEESVDCDGTWNVIANEGALAGDVLSTGFPVIVVGGPNTTGARAIITLKFKHSLTR